MDFTYFSKNKIQYGSIVFYSYIFIIGIFELVITIANETRTELDLTEKEIEAFKEIREFIEDNLTFVKTRVILLRFYSVLVIVTSFFLSFLNIYFNRRIKRSKKNLISSGVEDINNIPVENILMDDKN